MEMYNKIKLTKNKMYLNIRKMKNHPPSHVWADELTRIPNLTIETHTPIP